MDSLFRTSDPLIPIRGVHLDLKGTPPTAEHLLRLLPLIAAARYNALLVEWEDMFPWSADARFRSPIAYTAEQVQAFHQAASKLGLEVIPLVQCLGHMETPLSLPDYAPLRELPHLSSVLNPLAPGARDLVQRMVDDVLGHTPQARFFHLGGDEAWSFGSTPEAKAFIAAQGKGALYLQHVEPILDALIARNVRPILWHDMMIDWEPEALERLAAKADLMVWGYGETPYTTRGWHRREVIERLAAHHVRLWGAGAYKGGDGPSVDVPNLAGRAANAQGWYEAARDFHFIGAVATAWSRYTTHATQCSPIDGALDSLVNCGVIFHDGQPPAGGQEAIVQALHRVGWGEGFVRCKAALTKLSGTRDWCWREIRELHQQIALERREPGRRGSGMATGRVKDLAKAIDQLDAAAAEVALALEGRMQTPRVREYLLDRTEPVREQLASLSAQARELEPEAARRGE